MSSGWFKLAKEHFKDKGLSMQYHVAQDWFYRRFLFSRHERQTRKARLEKLMDLRTTVEYARTEGVELHQEGFKIIGPDAPFPRLVRLLREIDIPTPQREWNAGYGEVRPVCLKWMERISYAIEIKSLRIADKAWQYAQKRQNFKDRAAALRKSES